MSSAPGCFAEEEAPLDKQLSKNCPWIIYCETGILRRFLEYPGSTMYNPLLVRVTYRRKNEDSQWEPPKKYEDIWYKNGKAVVLRRYSTLVVEQDGVIYVKPSELLRDTPHAPNAISNAIARLVLDILTIKNANLRTAYVPKDIFEETTTELSNLGFQKFSTSSKDRTVMIHLTSYPPGFDSYLRHRNMMSKD